MKHSRTSMAWTALLMSAALTVACNRGPDPKDRVAAELKNANIEDVNIDYDNSHQVLHLKGAVASSTESARAEQIAKSIIGAGGSVANELTVKGVNESTANDMDGAIRRELNAKVGNDQRLEARSIDFDVNNGVVTIKGDVQNEAEKKTIAEMARTTANVRDVVNALTIDSTLSREKATATSGRDRSDSEQHRR